jgi:XTP/dITP diphosphohydrolase
MPSPTPRPWILASSNTGKLSEIQVIFNELNGQVITWQLQSTLGISDAIEDGQTFIENALIKARHASLAANAPAVADDSGLCVLALKGAPGLYSARFAGKHGDDAANNLKLLEVMREHENRAAYFISVCVWIAHAEDPAPCIGQGIWRGQILQAARGAAGFGYDPLFIGEGQSLSAAELAPNIKNQLSHRSLALAALKIDMQRRAVAAF